jgi:manganese oxidase
MKVPRNSIPMVGGKGPFDYSSMGGMFTMLKVREGLTEYKDPEWYHIRRTKSPMLRPLKICDDGIEVPNGESALQPAHHHPA